MSEPAASPLDAAASRRLTPLWIALGALPLLVAVVALSRYAWYPIGDLAQATLRQQSFWAHPPLVGPAGRIGIAGGPQGNHPGPAMFWLTWPVWWVLGGSSWAYQASVAVLAIGAYALVVVTGLRYHGPRVALAFATVGAILLRSFGASALTQPWNPYMPLIPYLLFVALCWVVLCGRVWGLPFAVAVGAYCVQCHVGYAPAVALGLALALVGAVVDIWHRHGRQPLPHPWRRLVGATAAALAVGVVVWIPPIIDQAVHDPGNFRIILDTYRDSSREVIGFGDGARILLTQLNPVGNWLLGTRTVLGAPLGGAVLLVAWAGAVVVAARSHHRALNRLNATLAAQLACALLWAVRLDSTRYLYLVEWFWVLTGLLVVSVSWSGLLVVRRVRPAWPVDRLWPAVAVGILVASTVSFAYSAARVHPPDLRYSDTVAALTPGTEAALDHADTYYVTWVDPDALGGNGFGLLLQLDRAGFDVKASQGFSAAVEPHRVGDPADADAVITVVSGDDNIAKARAVPGVEELAVTDHRTDAQRSEYRRLQARAVAQLRAAGMDEAADAVPTTIWVGLIDPNTPDDAFQTLSRMLAIGQATAVFRSDQPLPL